MLLIGLISMMALLITLSWQAKTETVQIVIGTFGVIGLLCFFGTAIWMVKRLGILAVAEGLKWTPLSRPIFACNKLTIGRVCV